MDPDIMQKYLEAGRIASKVRNETAKAVEDNMRLIDIAEYSENLIHEMGAKAAFPCNISVNEIASHYTPEYGIQRIAADDLVKIDIGVHIDGYIADTATTIEVGTNRNNILIRAAEKALDAAIKIIREDINTKQLGTVIENVIKSYNCTSVTDLTGHSIDRYTIHSGINIPNQANTSFGNILHAGDVIAIEPFTTRGPGRIKQGETRIFGLLHNKKQNHPEYQNLLSQFNTLPFTRRWMQNPDKLEKIRRFLRRYPVLIESDGYPVAQIEHTIIVNKHGCRVITD
jgi:methionyl aminopeptidase